MSDGLHSTQMRRRAATVCAIVAAPVAIAACGAATPITRNGPAQERIVSRVYPVAMNDLRARIVDRYSASHTQLSDAFRVLKMTDQPPPGYPSDWHAGYVDPGGFLKPYVDLPDSSRSHDLVLAEWTGDKYWTSEYQTSEGPVRFHCMLIVHFVPRSAAETEVQVFELVPTVWVGEHWALAKEGIGPAKVHDIRPVEPTVRDRRAVLDFVDSILK
jgi:hypothetical protein